jgi:flagellar hook protein FlgE
VSALLTAVTGIQTYQTRLDVISNNLANLNTPGFKAGRADFAEMLSQTISSATAALEDGRGGQNPQQVGLGVRTSDIKTIQTQGVLQVTNQPTDLAIQGNGFFMVTDGTNTYYTRAGAFTLDAEGSLVDPTTGYKVVALASNTAQGIPTVNIPLGASLAAQATTETEMNGNLNATTPTGEVVNASLRIFDSLGVAHDVRLTLTKTATDRTWDLVATLNSNTVGTGTVVFDTSGAFDAGSSTLTPLDITAADLGTGAADMMVDMDFTGVMQNSGASFISQSTQDGYAAGILETFTVGQDGTVTGLYSNGRTQTLDQIALATFSNPSGLQKAGLNLFRESVNSGLAQTGAPLIGGRGGLVSGSLESSNVDLTSTLADMIITQRGFQANARVVNAADQLVQDLLALAR